MVGSPYASGKASSWMVNVLDGTGFEFPEVSC